LNLKNLKSSRITPRITPNLGLIEKPSLGVIFDDKTGAFNSSFRFNFDKFFRSRITPNLGPIEIHI
jgi:hypothetical protein